MQHVSIRADGGFHSTNYRYITRSESQRLNEAGIDAGLMFVRQSDKTLQVLHSLA
jgi:hypothetical protein